MIESNRKKPMSFSTIIRLILDVGIFFTAIYVAKNPAVSNLVLNWSVCIIVGLLAAFSILSTLYEWNPELLSGAILRSSRSVEQADRDNKDNGRK